MADEPNQPVTPDASGAGTKPHKPTKAELAKMPGGADFDAEADGVSAADVEEHVRILTARKALKDLSAPAPVPVTVVDAAATEPAPVQPALVTKTDKHGQPQSLPQATWDALGSKRLAEYEDVKPQPAKPKDVQ